MKRIFFTLSIFAILAASSCEVEETGFAEPAQELSTQSESKPTAASDIARPSMPEEKPHPVSLEAMMQKQYDGRDFKLGAVLADNAVYTRHYITYKSGGLTVSGIANIPKGDGRFPVAILNHGYIDPAIYTNGRGLKREQDYLARAGFLVVHPDYRNHAQSDKDPENDVNFRLGYVEDVINLIYSLNTAELPQADVESVVMLGHSMGGGITQNIMVIKPELIDAAVLFAPVSADNRDNFEKWVRPREDVASEILKRYGSYDENTSFWEGISAKNYLERVMTPIMIHHGTEDEDVPLAWSQKFEKSLKQEGKDITLHVYEDEPHEFIDAWPLVMQRTVEFFNWHLL